MLSKAGLKGRIESELTTQGFQIVGPHAWASRMATAIANAVVDEIQANAKAVGTDTGTGGGSSHNLSIE